MDPEQEHPMRPFAVTHGVFGLLLGSAGLFAQVPGPPATIIPVANTAMAPLQLAVVAGTNKSTGEIKFQYTLLRPMTLTDHAPGGRGVPAVRHVSETVTTQIPLAGSSLFDARGNRLTVAAFLARVNIGDVIVIYEAGRLPEAAYLRIFKDDTLILVRGDAHTAPISANPLTPTDYVPNPR
jgi:hypothetical protein